MSGLESAGGFCKLLLEVLDNPRRHVNSSSGTVLVRRSEGGMVRFGISLNIVNLLFTFKFEILVVV